LCTHRNNILVKDQSNGGDWEIFVELETAVRAIVADKRSGHLIAAAEHGNQILLVGNKMVLALVLLTGRISHAWGA
jgi:hypothetical protein